MLRTHHLFTKVIIQTKMLLHGEVHKKILNFVDNNYEKEKSDNLMSIVNGMQYHDIFDGKKELDMEINKKCLLLTSQKILKSWLNVIDHKAHNLPHHHIAGTDLSGVYYLTSKNSPITFTQMDEIFELTPNQFDLIIFPSSLIHYVFPSESKEKRISYSFNLTSNIEEI